MLAIGTRGRSSAYGYLGLIYKVTASVLKSSITCVKDSLTLNLTHRTLLEGYKQLYISVPTYLENAQNVFAKQF